MKQMSELLMSGTLLLRELGSEGDKVGLVALARQGWSSAGLSVLAAVVDADQAALVPEDHRLYPVAETELGEDTAEMCFDGALGQKQRGGDLDIRQAARD
jgi:hypothetical protein